MGVATPRGVGGARRTLSAGGRSHALTHTSTQILRNKKTQERCRGIVDECSGEHGGAGEHRRPCEDARRDDVYVREREREHKDTGARWSHGVRHRLPQDISKALLSVRCRRSSSHLLHYVHTLPNAHLTITSFYVQFYFDLVVWRYT